MKISKNSKILILSHFYVRTLTGGGPPQEVRDYFLSRVNKIYYIEHPFPGTGDHRSSLTVYANGTIKKQIFTPPLIGPQPLFFILDILITFYFIALSKSRFDLCIALDNLNTASVLPFRKFGIIKKLVFYTIDYTPYRFENKILNFLYHYVDRIACYGADTIWVVARRMISARKKNGVDSKKTAPSIVFPIGVNLQHIKVLPYNLINRYQIVFVGILLEKQGIQLVLASLSKIISNFTKLKLVIIGQGEYEKSLKNLVSKLNIKKYVIFKGFVKSHREVEKILCKSAIGIAPYVPSAESFTIYADPGKVKLYLGCGLPIIITNVPAIAHVVKSKKAGIMVDYTIKSVSKALLSLLLNDDLYKKYRKNAIELSKKYNTNMLIEQAVKNTN